MSDLAEFLSVVLNGTCSHLIVFVCVSGSAGGRGEADGERARASAEIWRAADGEGGAHQQRSEILNTHTSS